MNYKFRLNAKPESIPSAVITLAFAGKWPGRRWHMRCEESLRHREQAAIPSANRHWSCAMLSHGVVRVVLVNPLSRDAVMDPLRAHHLRGAIMVSLFALLGLLAFTSWASAAPTEDRLLFRAGLAANLAAQAADGVTTWRALQRPGTTESNPAMRWATKDQWRLSATKIAGATVQTWALRKIHRRHPRAATVASWTLAAVTGAVAWRNSRQSRKI